MSKFDEKLNEISPKPTVDDKLKNVVKNIQQTKKKIATWYFWLPNAVIALFSLIIIGLYELAVAKFDPKIFSTAEFWNSYLSFQTAIWLLVLNILFTAYKVYKKKRKDYLDLKKRKDRLVTIDGQFNFIGKNASETSKNRKIKAWKIHQNGKLNDYLLKHEIYDLKGFLLKFEEEPIEEEKEAVTEEKEPKNVILEEITKEEIEHKRKIDKMLITLTDNWIEENIDYVKANKWHGFGFKFADVTREKLINGGHVIQTNHGESDFKEHGGTMFFDLFLSGFIFTSVLGFFLLSFGLSPKEANIETIIRIIIKTLLLLYNGFMAWYKSDEAFERTKLKVLNETTSEIEKYYRKEFTQEQRFEIEKQFDKTDSI